MQPKFNLDRPKVSDDEINKNKDFDKLVKQFKEQSIQKAKTDKSWWKSKQIKYAAVIAGVTVVCTVTYQALFNTSKSNANDKITTQSTKQTEQKVSPTKFINEPFSKLKVNYTTYKVDNTKGAEIKHPSASKIKIPKNSFVNKQGELITGEVEIQYREFHDQADIIASGIPMYYDSAGTRSVFESAGMFDIRGVKDGEPVFIKPGHEPVVEFASTQSADKYNQYYLDTLARNWKYLQRDNPVMPQGSADRSTPSVTKELQKIEKKYEPAIAAIPKRIDSVKVIYTSKIEKLAKPAQPLKPNKASGRPQFELDVDYKEFPELAAFKNAVFEIGPENRNFTKDMTSITWSSADISEGPQKGKNYLLTLKLRDRKEELIVYPVLTGSDYEAAEKSYENKFEKYKDLLAKREAQEKKLKEEMEAKQAAFLAQQKNMQEAMLREKLRVQKLQEASLNAQMQSGNVGVVLSRVFKISNFGIYNSDCAQPIPSSRQFSPIFVLDSKERPLMPEVLYLVETNRNIVFSYSQAGLSSMSIDPSVSYSACFLIGSKVYIVSKEEFAKVINANQNTFSVQKLDGETNDLFELKKLLGLTV